ncbi:MAG: hypothetical protein IH797_05360 [Chloroflexi bacterium]|nr:hypothetical protein [Chloroflexota bacterium]
MATQVKLLVGTKKGAFIYTSDERRQKWEISDPILPGWTFHHLSADLRDTQPRFYAAANHWAWGRSVAKSTDLGKTWDYRSKGLAFPPDMKSPSTRVPGEWQNTPPGTIGNIWSVAPGHPSEPGVVFAGTQPAGLFRSEDWGHSWRPVEAINRHPYRQYWSGTGGGDSCIHSIQVDPRDPRRIYLCVGAGGSYQSKDNGESWELFSHNAIPTDPEARKLMSEVAAQAPAALPPDKDPAGLDELHRMRLDPKNPNRIWGQAHWGVFRSDDSGATWEDVTHGLPSFHGFPIAVTHHQPDAAYVVPLDYGQDNFRVCPGQFAVYRTRDSGTTWQALTDGLPGPNDYQSVYREGLDTDGLDPEGVYVGTSNGQVYASADGGDHWQRLPGTLPPVLSVTCAVF